MGEKKGKDFRIVTKAKQKNEKEKKRGELSPFVFGFLSDKQEC